MYLNSQRGIFRLGSDLWKHSLKTAMCVCVWECVNMREKESERAWKHSRLELRFQWIIAVIASKRVQAPTLIWYSDFSLSVFPYWKRVDHVRFLPATQLLKVQKTCFPTESRAPGINTALPASQWPWAQVWLKIMPFDSVMTPNWGMAEVCLATLWCCWSAFFIKASGTG